jgi:hypothetical protein
VRGSEGGQDVQLPCDGLLLNRKCTKAHLHSIVSHIGCQGTPRMMTPLSS